MNSEDDLCCELHVEGFPRPQARRTVKVSDGVGDGTVAVHRAESRYQVDPVKEIEHLRPELYFQPLPDRNVLEDGEIHIAKCRPIKLVASEVAEERGRSRAIKCTGINPLLPTRCG